MFTGECMSVHQHRSSPLQLSCTAGYQRAVSNPDSDLHTLLSWLTSGEDQAYRNLLATLKEMIALNSSKYVRIIESNKYQKNKEG